MENTNIKIEFCIYTNYDCINIITNELSIIPTKIWKAGEEIGKTGITRDYYAWFYSTESIETLDLDVPMKIIRNLFMTQKEKLIDLKKLYDLEFVVEIVAIIENHAPPGICFDSSMIDFYHAISAKIDIDLYVN